ncbi:hypothetical protein [Nostoc sp.]|uniref:hypothetical protein n=1 Tax=Nostoc sp. TaxID=1180 RepID=UPI002FF4AE35
MHDHCAIANSPDWDLTLNWFVVNYKCMSDFGILYRSIVCVADVRRRGGLRQSQSDRIADNLRQPSAIARRFCTRSPVAGLAAARCGNFRLQLTTSLTSWWKLEVRSWKLGSVATSGERSPR